MRSAGAISELYAVGDLSVSLRPRFFFLTQGKSRKKERYLASRFNLVSSLRTCHRGLRIAALCSDTQLETAANPSGSIRIYQVGNRLPSGCLRVRFVRHFSQSVQRVFFLLFAVGIDINIATPNGVTSKIDEIIALPVTADEDDFKRWFPFSDQPVDFC